MMPSSIESGTEIASAMISAVRAARTSGLATIRLMPIPRNMSAASCACARPSAFSGLSVRP